jgi:protein-S-isoprenylcysteine O-methyltransferase Ste14
VSRLPSLGPRGEGWVALQGVLLVAIACCSFLPPDWSGTARVVTGVVGAILVGAGALLAVAGMRDLRSNLTPLPHPRDGATLIRSGSYSLVRHPIYGGIVIAAAGWGLVIASVAALALSALLLVFFDLKSRREEAWLTERFPDYPAYRRETRRLLPFIH